MIKLKNSIFKNDFFPDFNILREKNPKLKKYLIKNDEGKYIINWNDKNFISLLSKEILNYYFGINYYEIPDNYLIPPISSRLTYLELINNILKINKIENINIEGIDIGTGASIIYPLLGNKKFGWKFLCSESNKEAYNNAQKILIKNKLENVINLIYQENTNNIFINIIKNKKKKFIFNICNPPFYDYNTEIKIDSEYKYNEFNFNEVYYNGGEINFIIKMIKESFLFKNNIFLFTTLIGKKINSEKIIDFISNFKEIKNYNLIKINIGNNIRYILIWSFFDSFNEFNSNILFEEDYYKYIPILTDIK